MDGHRLLIRFSGAVAARVCSPLTPVYHGPRTRPEIALTFDDNDHPDRTIATLETLMHYRVPATLFVIGQAVEKYPAINHVIERGIEEGLFEVGDHSRSHPDLAQKLLPRGEIGAGVDAFRRMSGLPTVPLFRPPYGSTDARIGAIAARKGFRHLVLWDVDPRDWEGHSAATIEERVAAEAHEGAIVLLHSNTPHTAAALPNIIEGLRASGHTLVTISTLLQSRSPEPSDAP